MRRLPALAVTLPQFRPEPDTTRRALEDSHRLGYAGGFLFDHLWPLGQPERPALECWTLLAALAGHLSAIAQCAREGSAGSGAAEGSSAGPGAAGEAGPGAAGEAGAGAFRVGTLVTRAGLRPPALLAYMARTVGVIAGAPPIVGVGLGDAGSRLENEAFGIPYHPDPSERGAALLRAVDALRGPLAGRPAPPVWIGGTSRRALGLAGRVSDAWNGWGLGPDELAAGIAAVRRAAEEAGRDPGSVAGTWGGQVLVAEDGATARAMLERWSAGRPPAEVARTVVGEGASVAARLAELGEAGASWCVLAFVGGSAARMRALLAGACSLSGRPAGPFARDR